MIDRESRSPIVEGAAMTLSISQDVENTRYDRYSLVCYGKDGRTGGSGHDADIQP